MTEDLSNLLSRLTDLGHRLHEWNARVDGHFKSLWSFNSAPRADFEGSIQDAAATAEERAGPGPREQGYELLAQVCDAYAAADEGTRAAFRDVVDASRDLQVLCLWFAGWARRRLEATTAPEWLDRAVTAAALADTAPDYRDWYLTLGDVWISAAKLRLNTRGAFGRAAAAAAAPSAVGLPGRSTRDMLSGFEHSAFFAESVGPAVRRLEGG